MSQRGGGGGVVLCGLFGDVMNTLEGEGTRGGGGINGQSWGGGGPALYERGDGGEGCTPCMHSA